MLTLTNRPAALTHRPAAGKRTFLEAVIHAFHLRRTRRALAQLSAEQLEDIGITPQDAETEAARPIWDAPANWRG